MKKLLSLALALALSLSAHGAQISRADTPRPQRAPVVSALPTPVYETTAPVETPAVIEEEPVEVSAPVDTGIAYIPVTDYMVIDLDGTPYYDLRTSGSASIGQGDTAIPLDAYYGITLTGSTNLVTLTWHNYTDEDVHPTTVHIDGLYCVISQDMDDFDRAQGEPYKVSTSGAAGGPYKVTVGWSNGKETPILFYKNGEDIYYCRTSTHSVEYIRYWQERKQGIDQLIADSGYTPENSLDDSDGLWAYPVPAEYDQRKYRCDNQRWRDLADQLVPDRSISDEQKAVIIHDWMVENLAYDHYKSDVLGVTRAKYYNDYTGRYSMWDTRVGVCADFATVYCIMLRHLGVPTVGLEWNSVHVWNLVYLGGRWVEVDVTNDMPGHVYGADITAVTRYGNYDTYQTFDNPYDMGTVSASRGNHINYGMYTYKLVTNTGIY